MKVFKFGGASVKDEAGVERRQRPQPLPHDDLVIVVSAMGKTTNALEEVVWAFRAGRATRGWSIGCGARIWASWRLSLRGRRGIARLDDDFARLESLLQRASVRQPRSRLRPNRLARRNLGHQSRQRDLEAAGIANAWMDAADIVGTDDCIGAARRLACVIRACAGDVGGDRRASTADVDAGFHGGAPDGHHIGREGRTSAPPSSRFCRRRSA